METARTPIIEETEVQIIDMDSYEDVYEPHETYEAIMAKKPWLFQKGVSGNPEGRKAGKSMKEWMKEYLAKMTDDERLEFFKGMPKIDLWRMAEGNPSEDKHVKITVPVPILGGATQEKDHDMAYLSGDTTRAQVQNTALNEAVSDTPPMPQSETSL